MYLASSGGAHATCKRPDCCRRGVVLEPVRGAVSPMALTKINDPNPRFIFPGGRSMKTSQMPMFLHIAGRVKALTYVNMKTVRFYVQTAINLQRKYLGTPDCKKKGKHFNRFHLT